ncbi:hypothetical protein FP803_02075 [Candidatus Woesearchaeota archaeon]|nr:hypothetical protein [Candidatus Woesearchaeota archaeon]
MHNLTEIKNKLIEESFPELKYEKILVGYKKKFKNALFEYERPGKKKYFIKINELMKNAPLQAIEAGLAHEMAHIIREIKKGFFSSCFEGFLYKFSDRYKIVDERDADLAIVLRGYGKHLLELYKYREKLGLPLYEDNGLSASEIKKILSLS